MEQAPRRIRRLATALRSESVDPAFARAAAPAQSACEVSLARGRGLRLSLRALPASGGPGFALPHPSARSARMAQVYESTPGESFKWCTPFGQAWRGGVRKSESRSDAGQPAAALPCPARAPADPGRRRRAGTEPLAADPPQQAVTEGAQPIFITDWPLCRILIS